MSLAAETPMNASAPSRASATVRFFVSRAKRSLYSFMFSVRPFQMTPVRSTMRMFSSFTPYVM